MFRELARKNQRLDQKDCIALLQKERRGVLALQGDGGYPYALPINHWYCEKTGSLFFHSGMTGHKVDAMLRCDKASFCVYDQGERPEGEWAYHVRSVILFGRLQVVDDAVWAMEAVRQLSRQFTADEDYIESEIRQAADHTLVFELIPEHMTGKLVHEA